MPHLIIEYAQQLVRDEQLPAVLDAVHDAALATGLFDESHIKTRAIPVLFYRAGTDRTPFIHAQLRIHRGRNTGQKRVLSEAVLQALRQQLGEAQLITVEVVDMDRDSYAKYSAKK